MGGKCFLPLWLGDGDMRTRSTTRGVLRRPGDDKFKLKLELKFKLVLTCRLGGALLLLLLLGGGELKW